MTKHILIADDDRDVVRLLAGCCRCLGARVEEARDGFEASTHIFLRRKDGHPPDLLILDVGMPEEDGLSICEELLHDEATASIPVIVLTGWRDRGIVQRCRELGVHYVLKSENLWRELEPLIRDLLDLEPAGASVAQRVTLVPEAEDEQPVRPKLLCVDDDHLFTQVIEKRMAAHGIDVTRAFSAREGFWKAVNERPDVIITDYSMPAGRGSYLLRRLKKHLSTRNIPIVVVTGFDIAAGQGSGLELPLKQRLLNLGASCVLTKPLAQNELLEELARHIRLDVHSAACGEFSAC